MQTQRVPVITSQSRLATIAVVAAVHVAAIYTIGMAFNPSFSLKPRQDTPIDVVPTRTAPPSRMPPAIHPTLLNPDAPQPVPPVPKIDTTVTGVSNPTPAPRAGAEGAPPVVHPLAATLVPVHAIAGTHTTPNYPPLAARLNEQGSVRLALSIDESGNVKDASVVTSSGYRTLDEAAIAWVKSHWRFTPALRNGAPVPASTDTIVTFRLTDRQG